MTRVTPPTHSDLPIPPGEILAEELEARGIDHDDMAARLGWSLRDVGEVIAARRPITPEMALGLGRVLGTGPRFWTNLECRYRATLSRRRRRDLPAHSPRRPNEHPPVNGGACDE